MSGPDIFLSYARTDRPSARMFAEAFADEGFSVWWDASLHSGETFDEVIEQKLRDSAAVVVLWSPRSVASRWVRAEATQADRRNKLVPAIIEPCDRPIIFELTHAAELSDWTGDITDMRWRAFVDDLRRLIERRKAEADHPPQTAPAARAAPPARQPLRPGSEQVIVAGQPHRATTAHPAPAPPVDTHPEPSAPLDGSAEVHCLELQDSELGEELFVVDAAVVKMGRKPPADIVLSDKSVSREHCIIGLAADELLVTDLNSTNGTYIDDVRISRATILPVGSVLRLGQIALKHSVRARSDAEERKIALNGGPPFQGRLAATS